ncbi:MAG: multicopper oxidase family protein [Myxococcota bacterium]|nr:multicopper oxidase family protein [Myxococcota bacterium]
MRGPRGIGRAAAPSLPAAARARARLDDGGGGVGGRDGALKAALAIFGVACTGGSPRPGGADGPDVPDSGVVAGDSGVVQDPAPVQPQLEVIPDAEDLDPAEDVVHIRLTAAPATHTITDWRTGEVRTVDGYAFNGLMPGPTIRAQVGNTVIVDVENELDVPTTIHWHGLDVPVEMDGVPWMRAPIAPGETHTYTYTVERGVTAWYHPHFDTVRQVDLGLYGAFVVEDPAEPRADRDLVVVLDDWTEEQGASGYADAVHGAHGMEGWWTANGQVDPALPVVGGETLRMRLVNASNHGYLDLSLDQADLIARDQGLLAELETVDREVLGPGDRAELLVRPSVSDLALIDTPYSLNGGEALGEPEARLDLVVSEPAPSASDPAWSLSGARPTADPGRTDIAWTFQGSLHQDDWMISGERFPDVTIPEARLGQELIVEVRNLSAAEHPFHQHGPKFEVLSIDGVVPPSKRIEDTLNIPLYGTARLRFVPDRPGDWMSHCHVLPHADGGMMTVLRVAAD